jgi:hypothetical protein
MNIELSRRNRHRLRISMKSWKKLKKTSDERRKKRSNLRNSISSLNLSFKRKEVKVHKVVETPVDRVKDRVKGSLLILKLFKTGLKI